MQTCFAFDLPRYMLWCGINVLYLILNGLPDLQSSNWWYCFRYFPNINPNVLEAKRDLLNASYTTYCRSLPGCGVPEPDRIPFSMDAKKEPFTTRDHTVRCKNGYSLLSCGYDYIQTTRWEFYMSVHPSSTSSCLCRTMYGGFCVAYCTNAIVQGFEVVRSSLHRTSNTISAACPPGKKVNICIVRWARLRVNNRVLYLLIIWNYEFYLINLNLSSDLC